MALEPIVTWLEDDNMKDKEILSRLNYGTVNSDDSSPVKVLYIWNNYNGDVDVPKMEDVTLTTKDLSGGDGTTPGNLVEAVSKNWTQVRVDSKNSPNFVAIGRGGSGTTNPSGLVAIGTLGKTTNVNTDSAQVWQPNATFALDSWVKPTTPNGFIYKVTKVGQGGATEPQWQLTAGLLVNDGTAQYTAYAIEVQPGEAELLGMANNTADDGTGAELAAGNWVKLSTRISIPADASSGKNIYNYYLGFRYV